MICALEEEKSKRRLSLKKINNHQENINKSLHNRCLVSYHSERRRERRKRNELDKKSWTQVLGAYVVSMSFHPSPTSGGTPIAHSSAFFFLHAFFLANKAGEIFKVIMIKKKVHFVIFFCGKKLYTKPLSHEKNVVLDAQISSLNCIRRRHVLHLMEFARFRRIVQDIPETLDHI